MRTDRVNVLQIESGDRNFGGIASYHYRQYGMIDRKRVHYDFLYARHNSMAMMQNDPIFAESKIFTLDAVRKKKSRMDYKRVIQEVRRIARENKYDIVVLDTSNIEFAFACRFALTGIRRIAVVSQAHNAGIFVAPGSRREHYPVVTNIIDRICRFAIRNGSDYLIACSKQAGGFAFGTGAVNRNNFRLVKNAIHPEEFCPDQDKRKKIRKEAGCSMDTTVFGYAGRLSGEKNLGFLVDVFNELHKRNQNSVFWFVGEGPVREPLRIQAEELGLEESVTFWGLRPDVADLMQGMDAFIFPSFSEGLGIVAIEAQASGLPTIISDGVPDDVMITPLVRKVSLKASPLEWADEVMAKMREHPVRIPYAEELASAGYDVRIEAKRMEEFYWQLGQRVKKGFMGRYLKQMNLET